MNLWRVLSPQVELLTSQNTSTDQRPQAPTCSHGRRLPLNLPLSLILFWWQAVGYQASRGNVRQGRIAGTAAAKNIYDPL
jgi:hypothetical protein